MDYDPNAASDKHYSLEVQAKSELVAMLRHINAEYSKKSLVLKSSTILAVSLVFIAAPEENARPEYYGIALLFILSFYTLDVYYRKMEHIIIENIGHIRTSYGIELSDLSNILREKIAVHDSRFHDWLSRWNEKSSWLAPSLSLFYIPLLMGVIVYIAIVAYNYIPLIAS